MTSGRANFPVTAVATGVGSLPGSDPSEAARVVGGELAELAHVPELPMRGPWADMTGRACALLVDLPAELAVNRWQLTDRPGRDRARARSLLSQDLDALEEVSQESGASLKVQVCGPLTLASTVELRTGERVLADRAAIADLTASLAEGVATHLTDVRQRFPNVPAVLVQIDEPALVAVVRGSIPTASGYRRLPAVTPSFAKQCVDKVAAAARSADAWPMVHICTNDPLVDLVAEWDIEAISCPVG
ncbi:MAG: methionine synthase, partial [Candidatus Nanopelagicales bacterium]